MEPIEPCPWCEAVPSLVMERNPLYVCRCNNAACLVKPSTRPYCDAADAIAAWNRRARTPLETELVKVLADFAKWCDGWCPTHSCCANTVLPIHNAALAVLAKANAATGGGVG